MDGHGTCGVVAMLVVVCLALPAGDTAAQSLDGSYRGSLTCAKLPFTDAALDNEPVAVTIANGKARYWRTIYGANRRTVVGKETGNGTLAADGTLVLTGGWTGLRDSVKASYNGKLTGGAAVLSGKQIVRFQGHSYNRDCTMTLKR